MKIARQQPSVQVIVPARNEQDCIGACLESLVQQQGIDFQIKVVDDGSSDQTRAIAQSFPGVQVISAEESQSGWTGKCNAVICGAEGARAGWLLFTDADTVHYPGSLAAAVKEAEERGVDLLSCSPEQETISWSEKMLLPVVFAELARTFPPERVNNPNDSLAAANGQFILVRRETYERLGGHRRVANNVLEDVELARLFKRAGCKIWFRRGTGLVRARMYRSFSAMLEGWTKNLALLFAHPLLLALLRALEFIVIFGATASGAILGVTRHYESGLLCLLAAAFAAANSLLRIRTANFHWSAGLPAFFGLPLFSWVLLSSYLHLRVRRAVVWKGRVYPHSAPRAGIPSSIEESASEGSCEWSI
jgi:Glycosyl transferase family 2